MQSGFLSGDQALSQGAYEAGLLFAASYPGTPATEILESLACFKQIDSQWSVNEKVAYEVALASAVSGRRSLYASKHVGLNVAMDPLMTSAYTGINAGFVVVVCDDPGLHSSQNEQDSRLIAKWAKLPLLEPSSPSEAKDFVKYAFTLSEEFDTPVILRMTTRVAHTKENVFLGERKEAPAREFKIDIPKYVMVPGNAYKKHILLEEKINKLRKLSEKSKLNRAEINDTKLGFIATGVGYLYAKEMYPEASFLKLGFSYPFPRQLAKEFSDSVKDIFVIEELDPFLEEELKIAGINKIKTAHPSFRVGELRPEYIPDIVQGKERPPGLPAPRKPVMCPGCPHRNVFSVLKKLKLIVTGDIGCYTLGALAPLGALHSCLCMGAGVTFLEGFTRALGRNVVGVIGDSTFVHSGITGLINLSYNKTNAVLVILDNSTTAMTGSQPHPATGCTIKGEATKKLILEDICRACGADNVDVVNPYDIESLENLVKQRSSEDKLSVIIARYPCRLIKKDKAPYPEYDAGLCKSCYLCLALDCPAIKKDSDGKIKIEISFCAGCNLCVKTCKFGALKARG
ncbi:MAG: thiamine pyrophosphate-dependent enzyme [Candidatus Omnitrophica bacterium]|jgi:indolepyruvate ferredoxin oxidoreductase alpha subunit|nr:thiamine pyrophosphate-dependent enzyme [Candidatus Omnitrophota bacterium]